MQKRDIYLPVVLGQFFGAIVIHKIFWRYEILKRKVEGWGKRVSFKKGLRYKKHSSVLCCILGSAKDYW